MTQLSKWFDKTASRIKAGWNGQPSIIRQGRLTMDTVRGSEEVEVDLSVSSSEGVYQLSYRVAKKGSSKFLEERFDLSSREAFEQKLDEITKKIVETEHEILSSM